MWGWGRCGSVPEEDKYINKYSGLLSSIPQMQQTYYEMVCSMLRSSGEYAGWGSALSFSFYTVVVAKLKKILSLLLLSSFFCFASFPVTAIVLLLAVAVEVKEGEDCCAVDFANSCSVRLRSRFCCRSNIWRCRCQSRSCALITFSLLEESCWLARVFYRAPLMLSGLPSLVASPLCWVGFLVKPLTRKIKSIIST